jgi:pyruvate/2-oxoglutarate dehydrogenase complex dihydrolipoamide dehydrogenase (E3) component
MKSTYDFVVIGGGSAGYNSAGVAASLGRRVAVIDGARRLGGLCILRGCMPSKTLIYSAEVLHLAREGRTFGLNIKGATADMAGIHARKARIIGGFAKHRRKQLESGTFDLIRSKARFIDPRTIELADGRRIRARNFLIATGSRVSVPGLPGLAEASFWTSDDVLNLKSRSRSVIVLGGGIVACELAQFLNRVGTRVCVIQRSPDLLRGHSKEAAGVIRQAFEDAGIEVHTGTQIVGIHTGRKGASISFKEKGRTLRRHADRLFNALGREPQTEGLGLESAGVRVSPKGRVVINRWQQTSQPHIYAAGDCCGPHEIVHVAIQQGELAARHLAGIAGLKPIRESLLLSVIFTDPQIGSIGWSEEHLVKKRAKYLVASYPFNDHGKSILMNANYGYVKVMADHQTGRILGAEIVGKDAGELIHCFTVPLAMGATVFDMLRAPWYHPTLSEIVTYPLEEIAAKIAKRRKRRINLPSTTF